MEINDTDTPMDVNSYYFTVDKILHQLDFVHSMSFVCSCVERAAPLAARWSPTIAKDIARTLGECWKLAESDVQIGDISDQIEMLEGALERWYYAVEEEEDEFRGYQLGFADSAIEATIRLLRFASGAEASLAFSVAKVLFDLVFELGGDLYAYESGQFTSGYIETPETLNVKITSKVVQAELRKQIKDLERLDSAQNVENLIELIRSESKELAQEFLRQIAIIESHWGDHSDSD